MTINERLFKELDAKNLKQSDLAGFLNIRTSVIGNWKTRGTNPPAELLIPICEFLSISIYELLGAESKNEIEKLYNKLSIADKAIVDNILERYKTQEQKSLDSKIG